MLSVVAAAAHRDSHLAHRRILRRLTGRYHWNGLLNSWIGRSAGLERAVADGDRVAGAEMQS